MASPAPIATSLTRACLLAALSAAPAAAQSPAGGFIAINGGYQAATTEFADSFTFTRDQETGSTRASYPIDAGALFDVGGGVRLWRRFGVGLAVSHFTRDGTAGTTASVPHPLFLQQHRDVSGEADGIDREETAVHVQALFMLPLTGRLQIALMGGPSFWHVNQSMVTDVNYSETYPYDTATFTGVDTTRVTARKTGFNAGADVRWMFTRTVGAGAFVRFTRATVELEPAAGRTVPVDGGGAQMGAGLRIGF